MKILDIEEGIKDPVNVNIFPEKLGSTVTTALLLSAAN